MTLILLLKLLAKHMIPTLSVTITVICTSYETDQKSLHKYFIIFSDIIHSVVFRPHRLARIKSQIYDTLIPICSQYSWNYKSGYRCDDNKKGKCSNFYQDFGAGTAYPSSNHPRYFFIGVHFAHCLVFCVIFCPFSFDHCSVCPPIYGFRLSLWYLLSFLSNFEFIFLIERYHLM